jgi:hypothetical protein
VQTGVRFSLTQSCHAGIGDGPVVNAGQAHELVFDLSDEAMFQVSGQMGEIVVDDFALPTAQ